MKTKVNLIRTVILFCLLTFSTAASAYFDPTIGRWISRDPIGEQAGNNLFSYVGNNPQGAIDPLGNIGLLDVLITDSGEEVGEAVEIARGESLVSRVRNTIQAFDNLEKFEAGVMDAESLDVGGLLDSIEAAKGAVMQGLRGVGSEGRAIVALETDLHHVFPQAGAFAEFFGRNGVNPNGVLVKMNGFMHRLGVHPEWNKIWGDFVNKNPGLNGNPYYVIGFGFGLMDQITERVALPYDGM